VLWQGYGKSVQLWRKPVDHPDCNVYSWHMSSIVK
jgi:hypothetical protein